MEISSIDSKYFLSVPILQKIDGVSKQPKCCHYNRQLNRDWIRNIPSISKRWILTYATMRNLDKAENIKSAAAKESLPLHVTPLDVTDDLSVKNAVQSILSK
jgi:hypothetical protein